MSSCTLGTPCNACVPGHCSLGSFTASWSGIWKITECAVPQFLCIHGGSGTSSLLDLTLFWLAELRRKGFFLLSWEQSELSLACCHNRVHLWDNALTCEERLVTRAGMRHLSQCGIVPSMLLFSVIHHLSTELSISWGGMQRKRMKGQAKIFSLLFGLLCCECCGLRFRVNSFLLNQTQNLRNHLLQPTGWVVLHWDSSSWGAAGMTTNNNTPWPSREDSSPTYWQPKCC